MDLQERLDAEVWAQIMGRFVSILAEGVRKFGGTVDSSPGRQPGRGSVPVSPGDPLLR